MRTLPSGTWKTVVSFAMSSIVTRSSFASSATSPASVCFPRTVVRSDWTSSPLWVMRSPTALLRPSVPRIRPSAVGHSGRSSSEQRTPPAMKTWIA